jgi:pimeloyl-ACP methyl ester carboxylesterase
MPPVGHAIYLHGFASSPASSKAAAFGEELSGRDIGFSCPDLNEPSFETLTTTRMVEQTLREVAAAERGPVALIGSSLGGFVAVHAAARDTSKRIDRLVLLAPAFDFGGNRLQRFGPHSIDEWQRLGALDVFHYAYNEPRRIDYTLYSDAAAWDAFALDLDLPILIIQGRQDDVVDPGMVERWAAGRSNVTLHLVDDGHQLSESMPFLMSESIALLTR